MSALGYYACVLRT